MDAMRSADPVRIRPPQRPAGPAVGDAGLRMTYETPGWMKLEPQGSTDRSGEIGERERESGRKRGDEGQMGREGEIKEHSERLKEWAWVRHQTRVHGRRKSRSVGKQCTCHREKSATEATNTTPERQRRPCSPRPRGLRTRRSSRPGEGGRPIRVDGEK